LKKNVAYCVYCGADTELYAGGVPACGKCSGESAGRLEKLPIERKVLSTLHREILASTARAHAASKALIAIMGDIPSGLPHPDGSQRIQNASRVLSTARSEVMKAHSRLNDFMTRGIVPDDLKQDSGN
jgi:hypothetical protein